MVSRGTLVTWGPVLLALVLWYGLITYTEAPSWVVWAVLIGVGVVLPEILRRQT